MTTQNPADGPQPSVGTPPPANDPWHGRGFFARLRSIGVYRSDERWIGGVAGGLAARFGLDPLLVRGLFLVTLLLGGFGLVIYAVGWVLLPEERDGRIHLEGLSLGHPDIALLGALLMFVVGIGRGAWTDWPLVVPGWVQGLFWFGATVLVVVLVATMLSHRRPPRPGPVPPPPPGGPAGPYAGPYANGPATPYTGPAAPYPGPTSGPTGAPGSPAPGRAPGFGPAPTPGGTTSGPVTPGATTGGTTPPPPTAYGAAYGATAGQRPVTSPAPPAPSSTSSSTPPPWSSSPAGASAPAPTAYHYAAPPVPPAPPRPKQRTRGPGATTVGVTVALCLFVVAGALVAQRAGWPGGARWPDHAGVAATALALIVVILGAAIVVTGLRGRRSGVLGFLAVVAMIAGLPVALTTRDGLQPWTVDQGGVHVTQTEGTTTVVDRATAADGFRMAFGDATLDLTRVPMDAGRTLTVPIDISAGNLLVLVPPDAATGARINIGAGQVMWKVAGDDQSFSGVGRTDDVGVPADDAALRLDVHVGAGNVTVEEGTTAQPSPSATSSEEGTR